MKYTVNIMPYRKDPYAMYAVMVEADSPEEAAKAAISEIEWAAAGFDLEVMSVLEGHSQ